MTTSFTPGCLLPSSSVAGDHSRLNLANEIASRLAPLPNGGLNWRVNLGGASSLQYTYLGLANPDIPLDCHRRIRVASPGLEIFQAALPQFPIPGETRLLQRTEQFSADAPDYDWLLHQENANYLTRSAQGGHRSTGGGTGSVHDYQRAGRELASAFRGQLRNACRNRRRYESTLSNLASYWCDSAWQGFACACSP